MYIPGCWFGIRPKSGSSISAGSSSGDRTLMATFTASRTKSSRANIQCGLMLWDRSVELIASWKRNQFCQITNPVHHGSESVTNYSSNIYLYLEYPECRGELVDLGSVEHEILLESRERRLQVGPVLFRDEAPQAVHKNLQVWLKQIITSLITCNYWLVHWVW